MLNIKSSKKNYKYVRNAVNFGIIVAVVLILMITLHKLVHAAKQSPFYYSYMNVVINILPSSDMEIIETQEVVYKTGEYHFGFR